MMKTHRNCPRRLHSALAVVIVAAVLTVGMAIAGPIGSVEASTRSTGVPATPILRVALTPGMDIAGLSASQQREVAAETRWLQGRYQVILPRIGWTGSPTAITGAFDSPTQAATRFFQAWADHARGMLHLSPLFSGVTGIVDTETEAVIAVVGAYFQNHPRPAPVAFPGSSDQQGGWDVLNQDRTSRGLSPLTTNRELMAKAQAWSAHLAAAGALAHNLPLTTGVTSHWCLLGENVGYGPSVAQVENNFIIDAGINPPTHRMNIEDAAYNTVGIGVTFQNGSYWVVQDFMTAC